MFFIFINFLGINFLRGILLAHLERSSRGRGTSIVVPAYAKASAGQARALVIRIMVGWPSGLRRMLASQSGMPLRGRELILDVMYIVYILQSLKAKGNYIGYTNDLENRLLRHNHGAVKYTKSGRPWKVIYTDKLKSKSEAYRKEVEIKNYKGRVQFKKLINKERRGRVA